MLNKEYNPQGNLEEKELTDRDIQTSGTLVIIPCYNAGQRVIDVIENLIPLKIDVLVVDDGSTDGCIEPLLDYPISIISFPENRGKGCAIIEGLKAGLLDSKYETFCFIDADGQHDPCLVPQFIHMWRAFKYDLIIGQRILFSHSVPLASKIGNFITSYLFKKLMGCNLYDTQCGFRLYSRKFAEMIVKEVPPGRYETETIILLLAIKKNVIIGTIPIPTIYEKRNRSSHFRKLYDSYRVLNAIFKFSFIKRN